MNIEIGWRFYSADFSRQAHGENVRGGVMLIRSPEELIRWHALDEELKESADCPELYVNGFGMTIEEAIYDANISASHARPIP